MSVRMSATELTEGSIIFLCMYSQKATPPVPAAPKRPVGYSNECAIQLVVGRFSEPHTSLWGVLGVAFSGPHRNFFGRLLGFTGRF